MLPDPVYIHSRRQWVIGTSDPLRQFQTPAVICWNLLCIRQANQRQESSGYGWPMTFFYSANTDGGIGYDSIMHTVYTVTTFSQIVDELKIFSMLNKVLGNCQTPLFLGCGQRWLDGVYLLCCLLFFLDDL